MSNIDGFVAAVPMADKVAFVEYAAFYAKLFKEMGALQTVECWGDDVPDGKITSFPMAVKCEENETVVFSWIVWPDKATRDGCMEKMVSDPQYGPENHPMPFDGKRMIFGGFQPILEV